MSSSWSISRRIFFASFSSATSTVVVLVLTHVVFGHRDAIAAQRDVGLLLARNLTAVALYAVLLARNRL